MTGRKLSRVVAWVALFAALFAQAAMAIGSCLQPAAFSPEALAGMPAADHCHGGNSHSTDANLCLYQYSDQSDQTAPQPLVAPADVPVLTVITRIEFAPCRSESRLSVVPVANAPPIPIRFCSFRN